MSRFEKVYDRLKSGASFNWDFGEFKAFDRKGGLMTIQDIDNRMAIGYHVQEYLKIALHQETVMSFENKKGQIYIYY